MEFDKIRICHLRWAYFQTGEIVLANKSEIEMKGAFNKGYGWYHGSILPKGGQTIVRINKGGKWAVGIADCSDKDNYCKKYGRELALKRAIENMEKGKYDEDYQALMESRESVES